MVSSSWSTEYVNLGSILGNTAIIEDCSHTILSVPSANRKGYSFLMTADMRCIVTNHDNVVLIDAPIDHQERALPD